MSKLQRGVDDDIFENIDRITEILGKYISEASRTLRESKKYFHGMNGTPHDNKKRLALKYKDNKFFRLIMKSTKDVDDYDLIKEEILRTTNTLEKAREFLDNN